MASFATALGLKPAGATESITNYAPHFLIFQFVWAHAFTATRALKQRWGLDHNVAPRDDITRAEDAVKSGKITQSQLLFLKRNEAAHQNTIDNFPLFIGSVVLALVTQQSTVKVNRSCALYAIARIVYHYLYLSIERGTAVSGLRSVVWWAGNIVCFRLIWGARAALNVL